MVTSDMLLQLIADLQRDVTARQGRRRLLEYVCASSGARLALLFVFDGGRQLLILLDRWGRRSHVFSGLDGKKQARPPVSKRIPASGIFGAALRQQGLLHIVHASSDSRILPAESYWIGRYDQLVLSAVGEQQGVLVLCFEPEDLRPPGADPLAIPGDSNLRISLALLSAYLFDERVPAGGSAASRPAGVTSASARTPKQALQELPPGIQQLAQSYEQRLQAAIDEERERIAQNIHDSVAQQMADVLYKLEFIQRILDNEPEVARREIGRVSDILKEGLHELRHNISALIPPQLQEQGFETALRSILDEYKRNEPGVSIDYEGEALTRLPPSLEATVFRFIQEALLNVHKHAYADHIIIRIRVVAGLLLIEINDNGRGFDMTEVMGRQSSGAGYHIGLRNMSNRIHQAGGSWEIQSKRGSGTSVKARFRLASHPAALTNREREVLRLMADGLTNRAIAERLSVSTETVKSHVHHIMQKMHVNDRTQAAVIAARQQWL